MTISNTATTAAAMYMVRLVANRLRDDEVGTWPGVLGVGFVMDSSMGLGGNLACQTSAAQRISRLASSMPSKLALVLSATCTAVSATA